MELKYSYLLQYLKYKGLENTIYLREVDVRSW